MSVINIEAWTVADCTMWLAGLDSSLKGYARNFVQKGIDGKRLLNLMAGDLLTIGIEKVGDQVLLADAIQSLRNELESDRVTLQTLASNVSVRSKNLRNFTARAKKNFVSNESLAAASFLLDGGKTLLRWLTRFPFLGVPIYNEITNKMGKHLFELAYICKRDSFADNAIEEVQYLCTKIIEICEHIINMKDSLTIQPAAVDVITIRKRHEQELGLQFESSYFGLHMVTGHTSPAQQSGHLERGDEILQVNYQTVVGWTQAALVHLLYENPCEVVLTVKRRPRHASTGLGHMYLRPSKLPGRTNSKQSNTQSRKLGTGTIRANHPNPILEVEDDDDDEISITDHKTSTPDTLTVEANSGGVGYSAAQTRFWNQYPKPRNLLKRRATVTGSSPTSTRPPVTFTSESSTSHQQKSSMSGSGSRHRLDKCISAPERNKLEKQDQIEETLRLFVGDSNVRGSRVTLPCVGSNNTIAGGNLDFDSSSSSSSTVNPIKSSNQQTHSSNNNTTNTNKPTMAPIKSSLKIKENRKFVAELHKEDSLDDVFEPPSTPQLVTPIVVTTCSRLSNVNTLSVVTPKSSTGTTTTTTLPTTNETAEIINSSVSTTIKTTTSKEVSPNLSTANTPTPTTPTIINEVMKSKDSIVVLTELVKTSVPLSSLIVTSSLSSLTNVPNNSAIDNQNNHKETKVTTPTTPPTTTTITTTTTTTNTSVNQEKKENTVENKNVKAQTNPIQIESKTTKTFNALEKPQSLTNLVHQASIESNSSEKSELLHSGFLHQRQPHWKFGGPRWSRCRAIVDSQYFRLIKPEMEILLNAYNFSLANEVHSRPFAFKIEDKKDKATVHYFAAESQAELSIWMVYLNIEGGESPRGFASRSSFLNRSMSVQPEVQRSYSTPSSEKMQRRSSLPHSQHLQYQFRKKLSKLQTASSYSSSTSSIMEDKLKFWNSSPTPTGSPTHHQYNSNSKSNISSITITSCKRNQQQQEVPKSMNTTKPLDSSQRANLKTSTIIPTNESDNATESNTNATPTTTTSTARATLVKKPSLDSPTRKSRVTMGTASLLLKKDRKSSDSQNNNEMSCGTCGRSLLNQDKSTQTEELVVIFNTTGESRI